MRIVDLQPDYSAGGRADLEIPGGRFHLRGAAGPSPGETRTVVFLRQVHGGTILKDPAGMEEADGMILSGRGRCPGIRTADCLPVFIGSPGFSAAFHAGWRGIVAGIAGRMMTDYPERPEFILLGNCICSRCYRVGEDVRRKVMLASGSEDHPPGRIDLRTAVISQIAAAGLPAGAAVYSLSDCTMCRGDLFYSFRRDGTGERNLQWLCMD